jgi:hypothetical protein
VLPKPTLVPGVPNTTGKTQETDQNYGPFKSRYRMNIRALSQARFDKKLTIQVHDLPLLVFGGKCEHTEVELIDAFSTSFSIEKNLSCWQKCGAVPLTRLPLKSANVRREVPTGAAAANVAQKAGLPTDQSTGYATESLWRSLVPLLTHPTEVLTLFAAILYYTCPVRLNSLVITLLMLQPQLPKDPALRAWSHEGETKLVVVVD